MMSSDSQHMISVEQAKKLVRENTSRLTARQIPLQLCLGLVLAEDVLAPYSIPAYPQSSMDGYALAFEPDATTWTLKGEIAAGSDQVFQLERGCAVRIFTGAPVPTGADTVVMQEKTKVESDRLTLQDVQMKRGDHVRPVGSEIKQGDCAMKNGEVLTPATMGFLAGIGIAALKVFPRVRVSILVTGNELFHPGQPLPYGKVYESNSFLLLAALQQLHIHDIPVYRVPDSKDMLVNLLKEAMQQSDMVILAGGVSVGDYDFTVQALEECGIQKVFHKIRQKPGKPIVFGRKEEKIVFGLPGNPASVLTCFFEYVIPALEEMMSLPSAIRVVHAPLGDRYQKPVGLTHFLKAYYDGQQVELLSGQESYKLSAFAKANCLAVIPEEVSTVEAGGIIEVHLLPS